MMKLRMIKLEIVKLGMLVLVFCCDEAEDGEAGEEAGDSCARLLLR